VKNIKEIRTSKFRKCRRNAYTDRRAYNIFTLIKIYNNNIITTKIIFNELKGTRAFFLFNQYFVK